MRGRGVIDRISLRALRRTAELGAEADGPDSFPATVLALVEAAEAAQHFDQEYERIRRAAPQLVEWRQDAAWTLLHEKLSRFDFGEAE
jgi:hypothetical protein